MRSPEPNGSSRQGQGGLTQGGDYHSPYYSHLSAAQVAGSYYAPAMPPPDAYGSHHAGNQYYQPPSSVSNPKHTKSASKTRAKQVPCVSRSFSSTAGTVKQDITDLNSSSYAFDTSAAYRITDDDIFLELITDTVQTGHHPGYGPVTYYGAAPQTTYDYETRKRGYDALDAFFGQVKRREFDAINYQAVTRRLFELQGLQLPQIIPSNLNVPAYQPVSAVGGGYDSVDPIQSYSLPPMSNVKSRGDLTSIDQILEQMQATIYENDTHLAQSGTGQPGASYVAFNTRGDSNSPSDSHMSSISTQSPLHHHQSSISAATEAGTPGLTPSASSYTSGQSPLPQHNGSIGSAMYPSLPSSTADYAAIAANSAATMSSMYEDDARRRIGGGMLQRAAPSKSDDGMDIERDGSMTPPASSMNKGKAKGKESSPKDSVIDPALSGEAGTPKADKPEDEQETWLQNLRLIEWMREYIKRQLETGTFEGDEAQKQAQPDVKPEAVDADMTDVHDDSEQRKKDEEQLYPVLRHVEQDA